MDELVVTCTCGWSTRVPASALGNFGKCGRCGARIEVTKANTRTLTQAEKDVDLFLDEELSPDANAESRTDRTNGTDRTNRDTWAGAAGLAAAEPGAAGRCSRCGREFRGDWDMNRVGEETICDRCARSVEALDLGVAPPARPTVPAGSEVARAMSGRGWTGREDRITEERLAEQQRQRRKVEMVVLLVVAVITLLVVNLWPTGEAPPAPAPSESTQAMPAGASRELGPLVAGIGVALAVATKVLALYLALMTVNKLPNDGFARNLLALLPVAALIYVVGWLPIAGFILGLIIVLVVYEPGFYGLIYFLIFNILAGWLTWAIGKLVFGTLGLALF